MQKRKQSQKLSVAKNMPALHHTLPNQNFDIHKSEVINWLVNQVQIRQFIFDVVSQNKLINYDTNSQRWVGVDYGN